MALPLVGAATKLLSIGGIFGGGSKDPGRLATNAREYQKALAGDADALEFLRVHSRVSVNGSPGWGSAPAAADAAAKYQQVLAQRKVGGALTQLGGALANAGTAITPAPAPTATPKIEDPAAWTRDRALFVGAVTVGAVLMVIALSRGGDG